MKRESGFYWCKYDGEWTVVRYYGDHKYPWELSRVDGDFEEIDERRIDRHVYTLGMKHYDEDGKEIKDLA